jgi:hypothetical protein
MQEHRVPSRSRPTHVLKCLNDEANELKNDMSGIQRGNELTMTFFDCL